MNKYKLVNVIVIHNQPNDNDEKQNSKINKNQ